ncbi:flagellar assembly protein FliH [Pseudoduganella namucuonensis]|uniref:Flagellar assembly protein FliH n=1 Tax=Pseudoduganella namucuonensis TaxID=1035707 RepID=A0A1I7KZJ1_9BURK|nr:flagellar assembly protein FliH [Pseudoduganella namucuonensis]SFV02922.1 flagellar assembly protein FliH [Pseudoduganella namucuonensis]
MATLPKEQQTAFQRWEMKSFGDFRPSAIAAREAEAAAAPPPQQQAAHAGQPEPQYAEPEYLPPQYPTEEELAAIREEARIAGYGAGYAAGHAEGHADAIALGKEEVDKELEPLRELAGNFGQALHDADQLIAADVLELALQLSKAMLKQALQIRPSLILPIVRDAIEYLPVLQQPALLMLNPDDASVVREGIGEELDKGGWRVIDDPQIERGGCRIETASNQIDAQASARWHRLAAALGKTVDWLD